MKQSIHPEYGKTTVRCACGNVIETRSTTQGDIQVDICSSCHPFFTGKAKMIDTTGRIDRFKKKFGDKIAVAPPKKKLVELPAVKGKKKEEKQSEEA